MSKRYLEVIWMQHKGVGQKKCWSPAIVSDWRVIPGGPWIHPFLWRTNYAFFTQESRGSKQCVSNSVIFSSYWELGYVQLLGGWRQGYINRGTCSYPKPTSCHVLTSAYVIIFWAVARNAVNKSVGGLKKTKVKNLTGAPSNPIPLVKRSSEQFFFLQSFRHSYLRHFSRRLKRL